MYIMITERCNLTCAHCCFACTDRGEDMTRKTFIQACELASSRGDCLFIGGGEPTLHPLLFDFIGLALPHIEMGMGLGMVTNGIIENVALKLAHMNQAEELFHFELSLDDYHNKPTDRVIKAFGKNIRTVRSIKAAGRAKNWGNEEECVCDDLFVTPDGKIFHCGCRLTSFGTVFKPNIPDNHELYTCESGSLKGVLTL